MSRTPGRRSSRAPTIRFGRDELRDLAAAWLALGLAFTFFALTSTGRSLVPPTSLGAALFARVFVLSLVTVGVGFLLHELAHKVVAVRFGQTAAFRADYTMLGLAVFAGLAGFLFAAPGAVYHAGRITGRENGIIALAGPVTNVALVVCFLPLWFAGGFVGEVGQLGVTINAALAGFNMVPFGPLDGRKVKDWSLVVFLVAFLACAGLGVLAILFVGFPF
ncbi:MAG: metalloprotease [Haloarculaceae archaeon]